MQVDEKHIIAIYEKQVALLVNQNILLSAVILQKDETIATLRETINILKEPPLNLPDNPTPVERSQP
jgi:hypothetical protein